jgi:mono/diheme cytochrome c family protein
MVTYLRTIPAIRSGDLAAPRLTPAPTRPEESGRARADARGEEVYEAVCSGCHGWSGIGSAVSAANLIGSRAVNDPTAINVAQMIMRGASHRVTADGTADMPPFDGVYSDADIAAVANYVTARFGLERAELHASDVNKLRSEE